ncbi:MAG: ATP:cob(I)alamin adenosyltransferase, partial [Muribaculaceae bacterium]|nr:ATP:cob(I)alamin adenosyltransferase [Muribaculaceae bacterium]
MKRIYTRTGDKGMTAIHGGMRVAKTDIRIEANGTLDELNVAIGAVRTSLESGHSWQNILKDIQLNLMTVMSLVATCSEMRESNPNSLADN